MAETSDIVQDLCDLIETEQQAVLSGDLQQVADLTDQKAALIAQINARDLSGDEKVTQLQRGITRNQQLLQRAMDGIRIVSARLARLRDARAALTVYDADGRTQRYAADRKPEFERRA